MTVLKRVGLLLRKWFGLAVGLHVVLRLVLRTSLGFFRISVRERLRRRIGTVSGLGLKNGFRFWGSGFGSGVRFRIPYSVSF